MRDELDTPASDEPFALRALAILRRRAVLAFAVFAVVLVAAVTVALSLPDLFRSTAVVLVERQLPETVVRPAVTGELESRLHVIRQETLSRARLTELINRYDLYPDLRHTDMDQAIEQVRRDIEIELTGPEQVSGRTKTVAFNLSFTGAKRDTVAEVTNAIAAFYVSQNTQMRSDEAARTTQFLKSQIEAARSQLYRDEQQVKAFTSQHLGELPQQVDVNLATLERLNTQLRINSERQLRTLEQRDKLFEAPAPVLPPQPPPVSAEDARLRALRRELAQLDGFPEKHPDVRRLKDAIATLEAETRAAGSGASGPAPEAAKSAAAPAGRARTVASLDAELDVLKTEEAQLRQNIADVEQRLEAVPYRQSEFALLSRDHQATREQYESLVKRYEEARLGQNMENGAAGRAVPRARSRGAAGGAHGAEPPAPAPHGHVPGGVDGGAGRAGPRADRHVVPQRRRAAAVHEPAGAGGDSAPAAGGGRAVGAYRRHHRLDARRGGDRGHAVRARRAKTTSRWCACWRAAARHKDRSCERTHIGTRRGAGLAPPGTFAAEQYQNLRLKVERLQRDARSARGGRHQSGHERRQDADVDQPRRGAGAWARRPRAAHRRGSAASVRRTRSSGSPRTARASRRRLATPPAAFPDIARQVDGVNGLTVVPAGPPTHDVHELLRSPRFEQLLQDARGAYDFVVLDTPPLVPVCDAAVHVAAGGRHARGGRRPRDHAEAARRGPEPARRVEDARPRVQRRRGRARLAVRRLLPELTHEASLPRCVRVPALPWRPAAPFDGRRRRGSPRRRSDVPRLRRACIR